jgi:excisionase family DNA binding protein
MSSIEAPILPHHGSGKPEQDARTDLPEFLTVPEVAALLRLAPNTVYDLHSRGLMPGGRKLGRTIRFHYATVVEWFRSQDRGFPSSRRSR